MTNEPWPYAYVYVWYMYIYTYIFIYVEQFMYKCVQYIFTVWFSVFIRVGLWFIQDLLRVYLGLV